MERRKALAVAASLSFCVATVSVAMAANIGLQRSAGPAGPAGQLDVRSVAQLTKVNSPRIATDEAKDGAETDRSQADHSTAGNPDPASDESSGARTESEGPSSAGEESDDSVSRPAADDQANPPPPASSDDSPTTKPVPTTATSVPKPITTTTTTTRHDGDGDLDD